MKKASVIVVVLAASLGVGQIATAADGDKFKVKTKIKANAQTSSFGTYRIVTFSGKVKAKGKVKVSRRATAGKTTSAAVSPRISKGKAKKTCKKRRTVKIQGVGQTKTNKRGRFSLNAFASPGTYDVKAKRKKKKKGGDKVVCKPKRTSVTVS